jgi:uncharacterized protein (PEP-CTERM system associated)
MHWAARATWPLRSAIFLAVGQLCSASALAQTWRVEPSTRATATVTNNSGYANATDTGSDLVMEITPRVALTGRGARFKLDGYLEVNSLTYVDKTVPNEVIPKARVDANITAIERWLYLDAAVGVQQVAANPFSTVSSGSVPSVRLDTTQYRLSPYIDHPFSPNVSLQYRNDNIWTHRKSALAANDPRRDAEVQNQTFALTHKPIPFGFAMEGKQARTQYDNDPNTTLQLTSARLILSYAFDPTLTIGAVGGRERSEFASTIENDSIRGLRLRWRPSERTDLNANVERRFFDKGWDLTWSHRSPFLAMNINLVREPAAQPTSFLLPAGGSDFRTLVDAAYTTRYPNPVERAVVVNNAIAALGISSATTGAIEAFSDYAQVQQRAAASVVFLSPRSALTFQVFTLKSEQLQRATTTAIPLPPNVADNVQLGGSVSFNRRLTSTFAAEVALSGVKIEGIGVSQGQASSSKSARLSASQAVGPKTQVFAGARRQISNSSVVRPVQETALFLGIEHKF